MIKTVGKSIAISPKIIGYLYNCKHTILSECFIFSVHNNALFIIAVAAIAASGKRN